MKVLFCSFLLLVSSFVQGGESLSFAVQYKLQSEVMAEPRSYSVYLPPSYQQSNQSYPVVYLLDGDLHRFKAFVGLLEALSTNTLENQVQQAIVVAIPNTNRTRDLTPTQLPEWTFNGKVLDRFSQSGQAQRFSQFLATELIPEIEQTYRVSQQKVLVGESFGGLFAGYVYLQQPELFSDYLIIDPTALWHDNYLNRSLASQDQRDKPKANVFFAFANNSSLGPIGLTNYQWGQTFATKVAEGASASARIEQQYFADERHGTVALMAWYQGLKVLLVKSNGQ